MLFSETGR